MSSIQGIYLGAMPVVISIRFNALFPAVSRCEGGTLEETEGLDPLRLDALKVSGLVENKGRTFSSGARCLVPRQQHSDLEGKHRRPF